MNVRNVKFWDWTGRVVLFLAFALAITVAVYDRPLIAQRMTQAAQAVKATRAVPPSTTMPSSFTLVVTVKELDKIGRALGALPFNDVAPLINKLHQQVTQQRTRAVKTK